MAAGAAGKAATDAISAVEKVCVGGATEGLIAQVDIDDGIASQFHGFQDFDSALRGIQPNPIAQTPIQRSERPFSLMK